MTSWLTGPETDIWRVRSGIEYANMIIRPIFDGDRFDTTQRMALFRAFDMTQFAMIQRIYRNQLYFGKVLKP